VQAAVAAEAAGRVSSLLCRGLTCIPFWLAGGLFVVPAVSFAVVLSRQDGAVCGANSNHHVADIRADTAKLPVVGFCFSFAVEQTSLNCGKLMGWTKGFDVEGVIGKDVVQLLSGRCRAAGAARSSSAQCFPKCRGRCTLNRWDSLICCKYAYGA